MGKYKKEARAAKQELRFEQVHTRLLITCLSNYFIELLRFEQVHTRLLMAACYSYD